MSVHVSQFYSCSSIEMPCELYYVCELGKYLYKKYGESLSLDGVILHNALAKHTFWNYFRMAVASDWLIETGVSSVVLADSSQSPISWDLGNICNRLYTTEVLGYDAEDASRRSSDMLYAMYEPLPSTVCFKERTDSYWLWSADIGENSHYNNISLNHNCSDQAWLSLFAMVAVERLKTGSPDNLLVEFSSNYILNVMSLSYVLLLTEYTNCLTGWCHFHFNESISENMKLQLGYYAWYAKGRDKGYLSRPYSIKEKYARLQSLDIEVGDIVMVYDRDKAQRRNYIKSIEGCRMAKVTYLTPLNIGFEYIHTVKPYFMGKDDFRNNTMAVKEMYKGSLPYEQLRTSKGSFDFIDIGVEYFMHGEKHFILPLDVCDDVRVIKVSLDGKKVDKLVVGQNDLIYWILKDYGYAFNEERFLEKYFSDHEPLYTRYMRGETLEPEYYYNEG